LAASRELLPRNGSILRAGLNQPDSAAETFARLLKVSGEEAVSFGPASTYLRTLYLYFKECLKCLTILIPQPLAKTLESTFAIFISFAECLGRW
jgi:hypothetical protein